MDNYANAKFLFENIKKLYTKFELPNDLETEVWSEVIKDHTQSEILTALKTYRKEVVYDRAPTPAEFKNYLFKEKTTDIAETEYKAFAPAEWFMGRDIQLKRCRHNLYMYKRAVAYILDELLLQYIPATEWEKLNFAGKVKLAKENKLFGRMDEALVYVCRRDTGRDYEFQSESDLEASKERTANGANY